MSINNTEGLEVISWSRVYKATQEDKMLVKLIEEYRHSINCQSVLLTLK